MILFNTPETKCTLQKDVFQKVCFKNVYFPLPVYVLHECNHLLKVSAGTAISIKTM